MAAKSLSSRVKRFVSWSGERLLHKDPQYWLSLTLEEKRKVYKCGEDYLTLQSIPTWNEYKTQKSLLAKSRPLYAVNKILNSKVSLWQGDITCLEVDAIVNAANRSLLGGGGVDGCIHRAAGPSLLDECRQLGGCSTGHAKLTSGHQLPAKYVLHAVGPVGRQEKKLRSCYRTCLSVALKHEIRSLAFCCISTGIYGYPNRDAAFTALDTVRSWLEDSDHADKMDRIIFCTFLPIDVKIYEELMPQYFPDDVETEKTYSSDETDGQKSDVSSEDDTAPSKKERKNGDTAMGMTSSGNDTDNYENTDGHNSPDRQRDASEENQMSLTETEKRLKSTMRTVSAPAASCGQEQDDESVSLATASPEAETNDTTAATGNEPQVNSNADEGEEATDRSPSDTDTKINEAEEEMAGVGTN